MVWIQAGPKGMLVLGYRHKKWGQVWKLLWRAISWHPWIPVTLKLDSILSLFKCGIHWNRFQISPVQKRHEACLSGELGPWWRKTGTRWCPYPCWPLTAGMAGHDPPWGNNCLQLVHLQKWIVDNQTLLECFIFEGLAVDRVPSGSIEIDEVSAWNINMETH